VGQGEASVERDVGRVPFFGEERALALLAEPTARVRQVMRYMTVVMRWTKASPHRREPRSA